MLKTKAAIVREAARQGQGAAAGVAAGGGARRRRSNPRLDGYVKNIVSGAAQMWFDTRLR
jgi:hypothetical protein